MYCDWCGNKFGDESDTPDIGGALRVHEFTISRGNLPFAFQELNDRWAGRRVPALTFWQSNENHNTQKRNITIAANVCDPDAPQHAVWMSGAAGRIGMTEVLATDEVPA